MAIDVVIITTDRYENPSQRTWYNLQVLLEDEYVRDALEQRGLTTARVSWSNPEFEWGDCRALLLRSPWDCYERLAEFEAWLLAHEHHLRMFNSLETIRWNLDKRYLIDLDRCGIRTVETLMLPRHERQPLQDLMLARGWDEAILKPTMSATARHTYRVNERNAAEVQARFDALIEEEDFMLQPFQNAITEFGELSLVVIGGRYMHAVRKRPKSGDFRVQDDFGGSVVPFPAGDEEIAFAESAVAACDPSPIYARVDMVRNNEGRLAIMELELIEPELFFRFNRSAAFPLAEAIASEL